MSVIVGFQAYKNPYFIIHERPINWKPFTINNYTENALDSNGYYASIV